MDWRDDMSDLMLQIIKKDGTVAASKSDNTEVGLVYESAYEDGDFIELQCEKSGSYLVIQLDDAIGASFVYIKGNMVRFEVPFGEKKSCYSPKSFSGEKHLLYARFARMDEIESYKNVCLNKYDQHGQVEVYPHAWANVETRGESVFAAKNAINGNCENHSHGAWPYESWGINCNDDACILIEFGRMVEVDQIRMYTRSDFPHDNWWTSVLVTFSDESNILWNLEKTDKAHELTFDKRKVSWVRLDHLIKAEDPSPFPALTQFEVYGKEII